ncbi:MAG: GntR family transcriptional regulator [Propionibacteriaceae bacterium]|jgi:DNA-binding GntR family transcriptional regulator|nr:GntR family transcriptional regulator [Propionibacteriaceae bacterium]
MTGRDDDCGDLTTNQYLSLRDDILAGRFPIGSRLLETSLAAHYGVSRTPIREALAALERDGLIERSARGYRVRTGTAQDVIEIYEARIALESAVAAAAAQRRTDLDLVHLEDLLEQEVAAADEAEGHQLNAEWHEALWQAAHNVTMSSTLERWMAQLRIYDQGPPGPADDLTESQAEHRAILEAVRSRQAEAAAAIMSSHLERSRGLRLRARAHRGG